LGYVEKDFAKSGIEIGVQIREKYCPAQIAKLPFIKS
jgi:glycine cleavage system aminomethyltransferase T